MSINTKLHLREQNILKIIPYLENVNRQLFKYLMKHLSLQLLLF